jgi:hypothetical protein
MRKAIGFLLALVSLSLLVPVQDAAAQINTTCTDIQTGGQPDSIALRLRGVIVTAVRKSGASGGFWVQDRPSGGQGAQGDPFSGIFCFLGKNPTVQLGDSVTLVGTYMEYFEESEFNMRDCKVVTGIDSVTIVHRVGAVVPAPRKLTTCVLGPDGGALINQPPMEQWEGVLVELDSVRVKSDLANGEYSLEEADGDSLCVGLADTCLADDKFLHQQPPVGTFCRFFRGVFDETFTEHKIEPRGDFDIVISPLPAPAPEFAYVTSNTTIEIRWTYPLDATTAQNIANYSLLSGDFSLNTATLVESTLVRLTTGNQAPFRNIVTPQRIDIINVKNTDGITMNPGFVQFIAGVSDINFVQIQNATSDSSRVAGRTVCVAGVVTCGTSEAFNSNGGRFFIETTGGGPRSGLSVFNTQNLATVARGDSVRVAGLVGEFFNNTEISILDFVQVLGTKPVPGPNVVTLATAKTEDYEGVHVRVNGPLVVRLAPDPLPPNFNEVVLTAPAGTDTLLFNDLDGGGYAPLTLAVNDTLCFIQGPMDWSFGNRKVSPRNWLDICDQNATGVGDVSTITPMRSRLDQNHPNPFNPRTMITFALAKPGKASLVIYDISGRAVRTLVQGNLKADEYTEFWDGRNDDGVEVSSGIYFYKLLTPSFVETKKMVLLR